MTTNGGNGQFTNTTTGQPVVEGVTPISVGTEGGAEGLPGSGSQHEAHATQNSTENPQVDPVTVAKNEATAEILSGQTGIPPELMIEGKKVDAVEALASGEVDEAVGQVTGETSDGEAVEAASSQALVPVQREDQDTNSGQEEHTAPAREYPDFVTGKWREVYDEFLERTENRALLEEREFTMEQFNETFRQLMEGKLQPANGGGTNTVQEPMTDDWIYHLAVDQGVDLRQAFYIKATVEKQNKSTEPVSSPAEDAEVTTEDIALLDQLIQDQENAPDDSPQVANILPMRPTRKETALANTRLTRVERYVASLITGKSQGATPEGSQLTQREIFLARLIIARNFFIGFVSNKDAISVEENPIAAGLSVLKKTSRREVFTFMDSSILALEAVRATERASLELRGWNFIQTQTNPTTESLQQGAQQAMQETFRLGIEIQQLTRDVANLSPKGVPVQMDVATEIAAKNVRIHEAEQELIAADSHRIEAQEAARISETNEFTDYLGKDQAGREGVVAVKKQAVKNAQDHEETAKTNLSKVQDPLSIQIDRILKDQSNQNRQYMTPELIKFVKEPLAFFEENKETVQQLYENPNLVVLNKLPKKVRSLVMFFLMLFVAPIMQNMAEDSLAA